jgi:sulfur carrier protein
VCFRLHGLREVEDRDARNSFFVVALLPVTTIFLNGEPRDVEAETVAGLLAELGMSERGGVAVEVNAEVVPRSQHRALRLGQGDRVEIITMMAGG